MTSFPALSPSTFLSFTSASPHILSAGPSHSISSRRARGGTTGPGGVRGDVYHPQSTGLSFGPRRLSSGAGGTGGGGLDGGEVGNGARVENVDAMLRRALLGKMRLGTMTTVESESLSDLEEMVYHSEIALKQFGHAFLLPPGRRQTQLESEYPTSPTPSDQPDEHPQEQEGDGEGEGEGDGEEEDGEADGNEVDLDDGVEDMDASGGDGGGGGESGMEE